MPTTLQVQARALGDPTRHGVFEYLLDTGVPVGVAELTEHFGLNHNAIRQHLAKLVQAELVVESIAAPSGPGRPRLEYVVHPSAESRWGATGPYERLSMLLAEVVRSGEAPVVVGRRAGLRVRLAPAEHEDPVGAVVDEMARQGFAPLVRRRGDLAELTLTECPFTSAVLTDPETICQLHLGLAQGVAESVGGLAVEELVPRDPRRAHCRLTCRIDPN